MSVDKDGQGHEQPSIKLSIPASVGTVVTAPTPATDEEFETGRPVADLDLKFKWRTNEWLRLFDKHVEFIQGDIKRALVDDRQVVYLSCPISNRGGSFYAANVEIANHTQQRLLMSWGTGFWILNPAQYQMESKEGTGLIKGHARLIELETGEKIDVDKLSGESPPTGGDYMRMWTRVLAEDGYVREPGSDRPGNVGHCFTAYYFLGPSDVRDFFTRDGSVSLTAGVEEYLARKVSTDPAFRDYFSYPLKDDKGQPLPDERQAPEWERRRKEFFRYYTARASINFSRGSHDEWNILRLLNLRRLGSGHKELGLGNQIVGYFDGKQIAPGAVETAISAGYQVP
jgi:hypothetical protein